MEAFKNMAKHIKSKELNIFAMAVKIGKDSGGKFSDTLEKVEKTITYRKKLQNKIDVLTREASFGSYIVAVIGVFLYFMIDFNFQGKINTYFMTSQYGRWQLLGIASWVVIGLVVNKVMTKVEK
jgi:tight adherence protein B